MITSIVTAVNRWLRYRLPVLIGTAGARKVSYLSFNREINDEHFVNYGKRKESSARTLKALSLMANDPALPKKFKLLDVGCGPGAVAHLLQRDEALRDRVEYTGIDQSEGAIAHCIATWPGYTFEVRDAINDGLPNDKFDVIMINGVVEHMPDYKGVVDEALAKKPIVFALTTFGVIPQYRHDRRLWRPDTQCYMNSYAFMNVYTFLRSRVRGSIEIGDFGDIERSRYWYPRKSELMFYVHPEPTGAFSSKPLPRFT